MIIKGAEAFIGREFIRADISFQKTIERIESPGHCDSGTVYDAEGLYLIPGLVDIHTHGAVGKDFSEVKEDELPELMKWYAKHGVSSVLAATMTLPEDILSRALRTLSHYDANENPGCARIAGINLEGPFLSKEKNGAQSAAYLNKPDAELFKRFNKAADGKIRLVGIAPELVGADAFIREVKTYSRLSLAHSACGYSTACKAFESGADHVTHLFNAMNTMHHRAPSIQAAAFDNGAWTELIVDGLHVHPAVVRMAFELYKDKLCAISDSLSCTGMPEGIYRLGGQSIELKNGSARLLGSDTLAGSCISLFEGLQRLISFGISPEKAVYAVTTAPADSVGLNNIGRIKEGCLADFVICDRSFNIVDVFIGGKKIQD